MSAKNPPQQIALPLPELTPEQRIAQLQQANTAYRTRVQQESKAERAKPDAPYAVGRAALDEAMRILGRSRAELAHNPEGDE